MKYLSLLYFVFACFDVNEIITELYLPKKVSSVSGFEVSLQVKSTLESFVIPDDTRFGYQGDNSCEVYFIVEHQNEGGGYCQVSPHADYQYPFYLERKLDTITRGGSYKSHPLNLLSFYNFEKGKYRIKAFCRVFILNSGKEVLVESNWIYFSSSANFTFADLQKYSSH